MVNSLKFDTNDINNLNKEIAYFIRTNLEVEVYIITAYKLGEQVDLVKLENIQDKENIMKNKRKLRRLAGSKVFTENKLIETEKEIQKIS